MTVNELIDLLKEENPEMKIFIPGFEEFGFVEISRIDRDQDNVLVMPKR